MTEKNIEVELSGPLSINESEKLLKFLDKNGIKKTTKHRVLIDYSTFLGDGLKNRKKDIRLRITNGNPEIIVKLGDWSGTSQRKEFSVFTEIGSFDRLVQIFAALGYEKGMLCERTTRVYDYDGIEFAIVETPNHAFHFEAEIMSSENELQKSRLRIENTCSKLGLKIFSSEEYLAYIETLNNEVNEVFDFKDYTENYFEKRFNFKQEKAAR